MKFSKIILASQSPRRKELLKYIFPEFEVIPPHIDEELNLKPDLRLALEDLAHRKAKDVYNLNKDSLVIAADTVVVLEGEVLGKPANFHEAKSILSRLSGKEHRVITAVSVISEADSFTFSNEAKVEFYRLADSEIEEYINKSKPFDKAGSYGIQDKGCLFVKSICGDYNTIVGLPVAELFYRLKQSVAIMEHLA